MSGDGPARDTWIRAIPDTLQLQSLPVLDAKLEAHWIATAIASSAAALSATFAAGSGNMILLM